MSSLAHISTMLGEELKSPAHRNTL
jgi:hypothetical protein